MQPLRSGAQLISAESLAQADADWAKWRAEWVRRRKIFMSWVFPSFLPSPPTYHPPNCSLLNLDFLVFGNLSQTLYLHKMQKNFPKIWGSNLTQLNMSPSNTVNSVQILTRSREKRLASTLDGDLGISSITLRPSLLHHSPGWIFAAYSFDLCSAW